MRLVMTNKPLGRKAYGSIGHLPNSRVGPKDHHIHEGQLSILLKEPCGEWSGRQGGLPGKVGPDR